MKWIILSDIHANLPALDAVLEDIERRFPGIQSDKNHYEARITVAARSGRATSLIRACAAVVIINATTNIPIILFVILIVCSFR
jgi:hypothetical protein